MGQARTRRDRRQAARQPLPLGTLAGLDEDQERGASRHRAGDADRAEQACGGPPEVTPPALSGLAILKHANRYFITMGDKSGFLPRKLTERRFGTWVRLRG